MSNKLVIFDLDGVLIDSKDLHYKALNNALEKVDPKYKISYQEHLSKYDGLNTKKKLYMLTQEKGLPQESHNNVWKDKQEETFLMLENIPANTKGRTNLTALTSVPFFALQCPMEPLVIPIVSVAIPVAIDCEI
jgi:beta-phosphoglucomutase-like phosphatase (HAD superfamily)